MSVFDWDPVKFDVGVAKMNAEHKVLVDLMNSIHARNAAGAPKAELQGLLQRLGEATTRHFKSEEACMQALAFPSFAAHQRIHEKLLRDYGDHVQRFAAGDGRIGAEFFTFLSLWLRSHICHLDTQYGRLAPQRKSA